MKKVLLSVLFTVFGFSLFAQIASTKSYKLASTVSPKDYYADVVVFKLKPYVAQGATSRSISNFAFQNLLNEVGGTDVQQLFPNVNKSTTRRKKASSLDLIYEMKISNSKYLFHTINKLLKSGLVDYAEPKFISHSLYVPNDPGSDSLTGVQYHLKLIRAYEAWNDSTNRGDTNAVLGIIDTGFLNSHVDLKDNVKYNYADPINGSDDDNDGYIDNFAGWDLGDNDNDPTFENNHGLAVAGLSSATVDNDTLLAGTGFKCKFLPIKASPTGSASIVKGYEGIQYAVDHGCKVVNLSWGHTGYSQAEQEMVNDFVANYDLLIFAAAGNTTSPDYYYPASFDNVYSVTYSGSNDIKTGGNYNVKIDITAPGNGVVSLTQTGIQGRNGSSVATPIVAGAATALRAKYPTLKAMQIGEIIRRSADIVDTLASNAQFKGLMGYGRLNMLEAFKGMQGPAVRLRGISFTNLANGTVTGGDTAQLYCKFQNFLLPTTANLKIKISINSSYVKLLDSIFDAGVIGTLDSVTNLSSAFRFIISPDAPIDFEFAVRFSYLDDEYMDYEAIDLYCNPAKNLDITVNKTDLTISSKGRNGFTDFNGSGPSEGNGWSYNNKLYMYESGLMVATSPTKVSDGVRGIGVYNNHFKPLSNTALINNPTYDQLITSSFDDSNNGGSKVGVKVSQKSFAWNKSGIDKSVVVEYKVTNTTASTFDSIAVGLFTDVDVDGNNYDNNVTAWNSMHHVGYVYNNSNASLGYAGFKVLTPQKENFFAMDNSDGIGGNINPNTQFSAANKFSVLTGGIARTDAGVGVGGNDISVVIGATVYNLKPNETATVAIAYIMADNEAEMLSNADAIQEKYVEIRKSPKPQLADIEICKNTNATLSPSNGSKFEFYKSVTIDNANLLHSGNSYLTNTLNSDTAYYIVNKDSMFVSDVAKVNVKVANLNPDFTFTLDNVVPGKVSFASLNSANNWGWDFGDASTGSGQNVSNTYESANTYDIKLVITNGIGCKDSITKQVDVNNFVTNLTDLQKGEKFNVYPNPSTGSFNLDLQLNTKDAISIKVFDAIGNVLYVSKEMPKIIDISNVATGMYILQVQTGTRVLTQKLYLGSK